MFFFKIISFSFSFSCSFLFSCLQAIKTAYENNHGMSLMKAVNKACSGTYKKCLLACLFPTSEVKKSSY